MSNITIKNQLYNYKATVLRVIDGDTAELSINVGFHMTYTTTVRLLGVNTPELHAKDPQLRLAAKQATDFLKGLIEGKEVYLHTEKPDSFGRYLATIYIEGETLSVNELLIQSGLAVPYK